MPVPFAASRPPPLVSINEGDLHLILLTAIHGSAAFRAALVKKLSGMVIAEFVGARRAVYGQEGETDLLVEVRTESGERLAITIQVKIDSSFQPKQSERCRLRGEKGKALGQWDRFLTCLCAPRRYASLYVRIGDWDHVLFLEDAAEDLAIHDEPFASFLGAAIRQTADEYERDGHAAGLKATAFWMRYADLCRQEFPDLAMSRLPPISSSNDLRPRFLANILPRRCPPGAQSLEWLRRPRVPESRHEGARSKAWRPPAARVEHLVSPPDRHLAGGRAATGRRRPVRAADRGGAREPGNRQATGGVLAQRARANGIRPQAGD